MIEIKNFTKSYSDVKVYENFNLSIEEGKITCILGESGCGKTTLLNALAGLTDYIGEIDKMRCSYVFQTPHLAPNLTVYKNLKLVCSDDEKIDKILSALHIADKADSFPINLSGGQAQRVSVARAFLFDSDAILMDEPFSSLDLKLKYEIIELFVRVWKEDGRTAVFVTHNIDEAARLAQRLIVLREGKIVNDLKFDGDLPRDAAKTEDVRQKLINILL